MRLLKKATFLALAFVIFSIALPIAFAQSMLVTDLTNNNFTGIPNQDFEGSFKVTNNGSTQIGVSLTHQDFGDLEIKFDLENFNLQAGESKTIDFDIKSKAEDDEIYAGKFKAKQGSQEVFLNMSVDLRIPANFSKLEISNVELNDILIEANKNVTGFSPAKLTKLEFELKNTYNLTGDPSIDDFDIQATLINIKDQSTKDLAIDFDENVVLDYGEKKKFKSEEFRIPYDVEHLKNYRLVIDIEGEDEENRKHALRFESSIITEKKAKAAGFADILLASETVSCGGTLKVDVDFANTGTEKLDDGYFIIELQGLDVEKASSFIDLDDDDDEKITQTVSLEIPKGIKETYYVLKARAFANNKETHEEIHSFQVTSCTEDTPVVNNTPEITPEPPKVNTSEKNETAETQQAVEKKEPKVSASKTASDLEYDSIDTGDSNPLVIVIVSIMVVFILILLALLIVVFKK
jgi:hypothetical protein